MCIADWKKYLKIVRYSSFRGIIQCGPLLITFGLTFDQVKESFFHKFGLIFDQRAKWGQLNPGTFLWRGEFVHSQTRDLKVEPFCAMSLLLLTLNFVDEIDKNYATKLTVILMLHFLTDACSLSKAVIEQDISWNLRGSDPNFMKYHCVTQLKLYTVDKLSSPIYRIYSVVCLSGICVTQPNLFPIYTGKQALCWPYTM